MHPSLLRRPKNGGTCQSSCKYRNTVARFGFTSSWLRVVVVLRNLGLNDFIRVDDDRPNTPSIKCGTLQLPSGRM